MLATPALPALPVRTVTAHGVAVYCLDAGAGVPTLLLHGNPDSADAWLPLIAQVQARTPATLRWLVPELPGLARTPAPRDYAYDLSHMADFPAALLDALGIGEPVHLVVHDLGGMFGLAWAARHPERVRSLVILNTIFHADYRWHFWARVCRTPLLGELGMAILNWPLFRWEMLRGSAGLPTAFMRTSYERVTPAMKQHVLRLYRTLDPSCFRGWEEALLQLTARVPACVLWGDRDPYIPLRFAGRFGCPVRHFPGLGHWPHGEDPAALAALLVTLLT